MSNVFDGADVAAALCMKWEGFRSAPYLCPARVWTIGYGSTMIEDTPRANDPDAPRWIPVTQHTRPIPKAYAEYLLERDLTFRVGKVKSLCPVPMTAKQLGALTSFCYNLGVAALAGSTLRKRVREQNWPAAATEIRRWVWAGGKRQKGLVLRRQQEAEYLLEGVYQ